MLFNRGKQQLLGKCPSVVCLVVAGKLVWPYDPQGYASVSLVLLAGLTMPDWSARWGSRLKQHRLGSHNTPKGRKTLTENHWPSRLWGLGGRPITCPRKKQKITETAISQELISNGEAVAVDGGTTGHTMTSMGESLREAHRKSRGEGQWKESADKKGGPAGLKPGPQQKTGLVGKWKLQPYVPYGTERTN